MYRLSGSYSWLQRKAPQNLQCKPVNNCRGSHNFPLNFSFKFGESGSRPQIAQPTCYEWNKMTSSEGLPSNWSSRSVTLLVKRILKTNSSYSNEQRLQQIADAHHVTDDFALIEPLVLTTKCLIGQLRQFNQVIKEFDHKIKELFKSHPDHFLFESLPGAGAQLAPRLLSLFGSDRSRWADAADIQKYSGIAPVIERSGKSVWVHRRLSRPIFICQTFHEFAQQSVQRSAWADQYYRRQREKGKSHHSAIRALAFKWIRIIWACWKANKPYDESFYVHALEKRNSSLSTT